MIDSGNKTCGTDTEIAAEERRARTRGVHVLELIMICQMLQASQSPASAKKGITSLISIV